MSDRTKALVERLREVERLVSIKACAEAADRIEAQAAEIERLRDALKRIAGGWPKPMQLAREALEQKK